ncbi:3-phosphoserine/phosphohydroxythreonine transaminase [Texcoconibacillus texcoconensis]|uniref:Phosphoserine aminotransferase n=1 Tax=Texcoconibacillus texcoconensis TaxID=1095777 RepID=A0A840QPD5_9BACI|nr:3-phosphoserine/phosphohydroxythreonine transaminase [Texcoconibacillus texcoconensis]MBB5173235.1 phosphoserine aminotransferase [Texcoconibacillus texcoconensis]
MARFNFNPGPAALPKSVLETAQKEFTNYDSTHMSVLELSHRSKSYEDIHFEAVKRLRSLLDIPEQYEVLFLQGGASQQFAMVPMNFLNSEQSASYIVSGSWSEKALKEAKSIGQAEIYASTKDTNYTKIPDVHSIQNINEKTAYVHLTSNNTIYGTQWRDFPETDTTPLIADMSSDILSRRFDVRSFSLFYAGAQKNLGPSGVTVVVADRQFLEKSRKDIPTIFSYQTHVEKHSLYHTPPTFSIYMLNLVLKWVEEQGGIDAIESLNKQKAEKLYDAIDHSNNFYKGHAEVASRSAMNVTFTLENKELEELFLQEAEEAGFSGLKGHRSVGGLRASLYNAVPLEAVNALCSFMDDFRHRHQ